MIAHLKNISRENNMTTLIDFLGAKQRVNIVPKVIPSQLNEYIDDNVLILDTYKQKGLNKFLENNNLDYIYFSDYGEEGSYVDKIENFKKILIDNNINTYIFYLFQASTAFNIENFSNVTKLIENRHNYDYARKKYLSVDKALIKLCRVIAALEVCDKVIQFSWDNDEIVLNKAFEDYGKADKISTYITQTDCRNYLPIYEKFLHDRINKDNKKHKKELDFVFFMSAIKTKNDLRGDVRENKDYFESYNDDKFIIDIQETYTQDMIPQNEYYDLLSKSLFTFAYKTYNEESFSQIRIFEALFNNCIPIIMQHKGVKHFENTFPYLYEKFVDNELFIDGFNPYELKEKVFALKQNHDKILLDIKSAKDYKNVLDEDFIKEYYKKVFYG